MQLRTSQAAVLFMMGLLGCQDAPPPALEFGAQGPLTGDAGRGSFSFGVTTAATQIEDANQNTNWYAWTEPAPGGLGKGAFVGDAVKGYAMAVDDVALLVELGVDTYRLSLEWARIEPERDVYDEAALAHYDEVIDALLAAQIRPVITIHHFSNPLWFEDPRLATCPVKDAPKNTAQLCGWAGDDDGSEAVQELAEFAGMLAARYGARVDAWMTINEPINYLVAAYGAGVFPPGKNYLLSDFTRFMAAARNLLAAHVAVFDAIKAADVVDADDDGVAAAVGLPLSVAEWTPSRDNELSDHPDDVAAAARVQRVYHYLFVDSLLAGQFDSDLDGEFDEDQPTWQGKLDWLGVQYYSRISVTGKLRLIPGVDAMLCFGTFDLGSCLPPQDPTKWIEEMGYEWYEPGIFNVLTDFSRRWPALPLVVTESGIATTSGQRRIEHIVRSLEQIRRAILAGADVRGYWHWTLLDNFEWAFGYAPRFGLYAVDRGGAFARTATAAVSVLREIATARKVSGARRQQHGGLGPMTPEPE
ncbi:MAG: glycoside hydrolase family 1 protein [Myxococcales bacterium]|nr:glycoside hydrolase family 1 protein [Myxococcales bacterium]